MEFQILGSLDVRADGGPVALRGAKPRALLAVLLLHANEPMSAERLAVALWGEDAPAGAAKTVQVYVSRLRRALGEPNALATTPGGYQLRVLQGELDADRFEHLAAEGHRALADGAPARARRVFREALSLWRGPALAEFAFEAFAQAEIARLDEERLAVLEARVQADLALGRHAELAGELAQLVAAHPLRERLRGQLMLSLYRSGRQGDALQAYRDAREVLVEQLGIEPGTELHDLNQAILVHDPELEPPRAPMASASDRRGALPAPPNRTIGRVDEVTTLGERLRPGSLRLLTLTGPGGVGKTRLALEAARAVELHYADGAHFVSLAALNRPEDVPAAIVATFEIIVLSGESPAESVERFLSTKQLLLVMDNFEQLLDAAAFIGALLVACPELTVLVTSREPLTLAAEERYPVLPLALPLPGSGDDAKTLATVDAVALFGERARAHDPHFHIYDGNAAVVAEICRHLDGLPLAIELAAARCGVLSPREIAERLDASLAALAVGPRDAPARQQTLRATIEWSFELLSVAEKACFPRFAVFAGGATVSAAETVIRADLDTLDRLVAKSLLVRQQDAHRRTRLTMLETVRTYAIERFAASADRDAVEERHYRYYAAFAERHGTERALCGRNRGQQLARLDAEINNLQASVRWAIDKRDAEHALALVAALGWYWVIRARYADAGHWIDQALDVSGAECHPTLRARALLSKVVVLWPLGRSGELAAVVAELEVLATTLGEPVITSQVLQLRAVLAHDAGQRDAADALADEALHWAQASGDQWEIAKATYEKVRSAPTITELRERVDQAASLLEEVGNTHQLASLFATAPYGALSMDSDRDAMEMVERAIPIVHEHGTPFLRTLFCGNLGLAALMTGDTDRATDAFREQLTLCRKLVVLPLASEGLRGLAALAALRRDDDRAARLAGAAAAHRYAEPEDAVEARLTANFLRPAHSRIGPDAWDAAARKGAELSFQDAIADALDRAPV